MATLRQYFDTDFPSSLGSHRSRSFEASPGGKFDVIERLHSDFGSNAKFISYFIPSDISDPVPLCDYILQHPEWAMSMTESVAVEAGGAGDRMIASSALRFTDMIVFYIDVALSGEDKDAIVKAGEDRG